jgi:hypothetical protein
MAILLGSVTEGEKHVPPDQVLESGRFRAKADFASALAKGLVAIDPKQTFGSSAITSEAFGPVD